MKKILRLFLMSVLCGIVPFTMLFGGVSVSAYTGNSLQPLTTGADIRVMSYNTLVDNDENLGGWSWGQALGTRGDKAAAAIAYYKPDVIGLQENNYKWHVSLRKNLPDYDYVNADVPWSSPLEAKESLGKKDWMCTTMMYNTKTVEVVDYELYGYSCNYWGCIQRMRYISMALFKVKATGEHFVFISTHLDAEKDAKGQSMRRTQATELAEAIQYYKETYGCPVIATGDFNSGYTDEPLTIVREQAGMTSHGNNRGGIDYVLFSQGVSAKYFTVVNDSDLAGASDHQPIFADLALDNGFSFPTTATTTMPTEEETTTTTVTTTTARPTTQTKPATTAAPITEVPTTVIEVPTTTTTATTLQSTEIAPAVSETTNALDATEPGAGIDDSVTTTTIARSTKSNEKDRDDEVGLLSAMTFSDGRVVLGVLLYVVAAAVVATIVLSIFVLSKKGK